MCLDMLHSHLFYFVIFWFRACFSFLSFVIFFFKGWIHGHLVFFSFGIPFLLSFWLSHMSDLCIGFRIKIILDDQKLNIHFILNDFLSLL